VSDREKGEIDFFCVRKKNYKSVKKIIAHLNSTQEGEIKKALVQDGN
jgi:hypothetical protein